MLRFQNHLRIFLFQNAKILRILIKSLFLESHKIPILRISYKKGSLLKLRTSHRRLQTTTDESHTSHRRLRRVTDEPRTTTDESETSHKKLQTSHRRVTDDYEGSFRKFFRMHL